MSMMPFFYPGQSVPGMFSNTQGIPGLSPPFAPNAQCEPPLPIQATGTPNHTTPSSSESCTPTASIDSVEIVSWLLYLDGHKIRSKDEICFSAYGQGFTRNGFIWISQLTSRFVTPEKLVEWLGIEIGHAILILQYLEQDIDAIKAGTLVIPAIGDDEIFELGDDLSCE
jgi:hypothetical protein